jgi:acyl carrier protein
MRFESESELENWLVKSLSEHADIPLEDIHPSMSFAALGVDSVESVSLAAELDAAFEGFTIKPELFWEVDTIRQLASELFAKSSDDVAATGA